MTPTLWTILAAAAGLAAAVTVAARRRPAARPRPPGRWWRLWVIGVAAGSFLVNAGLALTRGFPEPRVQDEFSYLLAADTFAHGRLANPTPPAWPALQSFHVLLVPTYASKYPPGQGLALAAGQVTAGLPIAGGWLATAALVAAAGWAAAGLLPPAWAVGTAVLVALHPQVIEWSQTYWGGEVAATGGALVLGGWARLTKSPGQASTDIDARAATGRTVRETQPQRHEAGHEGQKSRGEEAEAGPPSARLPLRVLRVPFAPSWSSARTSDGRTPASVIGRQSRVPSALLGVGLGVLLNSRPYEGAAFAAVVVLDLLRQRPRSLLPAAVALLPIVAWTGVYNASVTGRPWRLPYLAYEDQYAAAPPLLFASPRPVPPRIPASMRAYAEQVELPHDLAQRTVHGFATTAAGKVWFLATATLPSPWLWPLAALAARAAWRDRRLRVVAAALIATLLATLASNWTRTQYVAPATAAAAVLLAAGAAGVARPLWAAAVVATALLPFGPVPPGPRFQRDQLVAALDQEPGRQLVLVRYGPDHRPDDEWVYNTADPPSAKVVWARDGDDTGVTADQVRAAYPGRAIWHLDVTAAAAAIRRE